MSLLGPNEGRIVASPAARVDKLRRGWSTIGHPLAEEPAMAMRIHTSRRAVLKGAIAAGAGLLPSRAFGQSARGVLTVAADTEQRNWNSAMIASNGVFFVANKVLEPLVDQAFGGSGFKPVLATGWKAAADGRSIAFDMRRGVKWHDGRDLTSADVAFSALEIWKKLQNFGRVVFKDLEAVDTPDPATAVFRFAKPIPPQLIVNALPALSTVIPKHLYENTDIANNPANLKPIGTGPYRFEEHRRGEFIRLDRNASYWEANLPRIERILYRVMPDKGAVAAAHESGDLLLSSFSAVSTADAIRLGKAKGLQVTTRGYEGILYTCTVEINHRKKELADVRVRRAIRHAIDPKFLLDTVFQGFGAIASGPIPATGAPFHTRDVAAYAFDPAAAERLLDEAGYRRGADGNRFALRIVPAPFFEQTRLTGDYLRQALRRIGIDAQIQTYDAAGHIAKVYREHDFDVAVAALVYRNDPAISTTVLYRSGTPAGVPFANQYGYADAEMDRLIDQAASETRDDERIKLYAAFQKKVMTDLPILPLIDFPFLSVVSDRVKDHHNTPRWPVSSWADVSVA
jgi:peptide/nickel transport system substrate-binding protein